MRIWQEAGKKSSQWAAELEPEPGPNELPEIRYPVLNVTVPLQLYLLLLF
jgi:hypothetical protein